MWSRKGSTVQEEVNFTSSCPGVSADSTLGPHGWHQGSHCGHALFIYSFIFNKKPKEISCESLPLSCVAHIPPRMSSELRPPPTDVE